ncbi:chemotaxis protein CheW, partial [Halapricum sp. CBA1109]|uniref:chemotaxis protein CheW n=1 Tax=Halapricum sp. CBA1109 TaxID=2668068 RepID=UPI0012F8BDE7
TTTATPEERSNQSPDDGADGGETATGNGGDETATEEEGIEADDTPTEAAEADPTDDESAWFDDDADEGGAGTAAAASQSDGDEGETAADKGETTTAAAAAAGAAAEFERDEVTTVDAEESAQAVTEAEEEAESEEEVRVLEFELGDERYCLDIMYVEEIVKEEQITRVPNTPDFVRGVVDLRGQITTILDPKESIGIEGETSDELIVVFDGDTFEDQGHIGWAVDEVRQVTPVTESEVKESPVDQKHVNGVIERDDEFVIWTRPEIALAEAAAEAEADADN